jgi:hypothetical protein
MGNPFLDQLLSDVFDTAHADNRGELRHTALVQVLLELLEGAGVVQAPEVSYCRRERPNLAAEVHGYALDVEEDVLTLFYCIDATENVPLGVPASVVSLGKDSIDRGLKRLASFVRFAKSDRGGEIDESQAAADLVNLIRNSEESGYAIEFCVLATGNVSERAFASEVSAGFKCEVWDLVRLERVCGERGGGAISVEFESEFGAALPCLMTERSPDGLQVLLATIPGKMLAGIYNKHRAALLERNVRSFLQFTGKVNKGIRSTILAEPFRFLSYNNGLSATAAEVELEVQADGLGRLKAVHDFQIVNGGQTTASLASCARRDNADLSSVMVQMKLTVVPSQLLDGLVPQISRFANTQNRIQDSDFSANEPWHSAIERHSREHWTRPMEGAPRGTRWFYERSRGQYSDALAACATQAGKRQFRAENPTCQKFNKTDLAKCLMSWEQYPSIVSQGAQKCFGEFMKILGAAARTEPGEARFRHLVAVTMLFRCAERLYGELGFQGYRANVVTYAVARLSHARRKELAVDEIWSLQEIPEELKSQLKLVIVGVRDVIVNPPPGQKNPSEWSKDEACWAAVLGREMDLPRGEVAPTGPPGVSSALGEETPEESALINAAVAVPRSVWLAVSNWARATQSLQVWQRKLAYSLGTLSRPPSLKQARQGRKLLLEAMRVGFTSDELSSDVLENLRSIPEAT